MKKLMLHGFLVTIFLLTLHRLFLLFFTSMNPEMIADIPNQYVFLSVPILFMLYMIGSTKKIMETISHVCCARKWSRYLLMVCHIGAGLLSMIITVCYLILMYIE